MNKSFRQGQILKLIRGHGIHTQDELARELQDLGIQATQVTLSRDIRDLGLVKTSEGYRQITPETTGPDLANIASEFLLDIRVAQNLLVLKTSPAHASSLARAIDEAEWDDIAGTIAGDDTVLLITSTNETATAVRERLLRLIS